MGSECYKSVLNATSQCLPSCTGIYANVAKSKFENYAGENIDGLQKMLTKYKQRLFDNIEFSLEAKKTNQSKSLYPIHT